MDRRLYEASRNGSVLALKKLMQEDELILDRVGVTCFHETPLHIAAMRGHLGFTRELLIQKFELATELNSFGHSPLHLASVEGHVEIVRELHVNSEVCGTRDFEGRTPLHLAAMKGRVGVIEELTRTRPKSAYERLDRGETVLHLCIRYHRLEALKYLVESIKEKEFVNSKDNDGNTMLHLAAIFKQIETIKYLFSREEVKGNANAKNVNGFTALDVLDYCPRDVKVMEMREFLLEVGVGRAINHGTDHLNPLPENIISTCDFDVHGVRTPMDHRSSDVSSMLHLQNLVTVTHSHTIKGICMIFLSVLKKAWGYLCAIWNKYFTINNEWLKEARGNLMIVATVTASMSFQAGVNPPGSVWQENKNATNSTPEIMAGTAIMDTNFSDDFKLFLRFNTLSLIASLSIILLMISGFPLKNKFSLWLLTAAMSTSVTFIALTYLQSIYMITWHSWDEAISMSNITIYIWIGLYGIVTLIHSINILVWVVKKSRKFLNGKGWLKCGAGQEINEQPVLAVQLED